MELDLDIVVLGGGPAWASAALYAARSGARTVAVEDPGMAAEEEDEISLRLRAYAQELGAKFVSEKVSGISLDGAEKVVSTEEGNRYRARALVLVSAPVSARPGMREYLGKGLSQCAACDAAHVRGQEVLVYGPIAQASAEADHLTRFARRVRLACPEEATEASVASDVELLLGSALLAVCGDGRRVNGAVLRRAGREVRVAASRVFVVGPGGPLFSELPLEIRPDGTVEADEEGQTSVSGVFACAARGPAALAAAEGFVAALSAVRFLDLLGAPATV